MNESAESASQPHNADEIGQYQSLSTTAVVALLLGLASPLFFASPIFSVVPVCGIAVACLALVRIAAAEGALTGRLVAKAGLALSVAFLLAPVAHSYVRNAAAGGLAKEAARNWLEAVVAEDWNRGASLVTPAKLYSLIPRSPSPDAAPPKYDREFAIQQFSQDATILAITAAANGEESDFQFHDLEFNWAARKLEVGCPATLSGSDSDSLDCWILMERNPSPQGQNVWLVNGWKLFSKVN